MNKKTNYPKIQITPDLRVSIENCFIIQEPLSTNKTTGEVTWSNSAYITSWDSLIRNLSKRIFLANVENRDTLDFKEAHKEYLVSIESLKNILTKDLDSAVSDLSNDMKERLKRY